jgi:hypothetical protein
MSYTCETIVERSLVLFRLVILIVDDSSDHHRHCERSEAIQRRHCERSEAIQRRHCERSEAIQYFTKYTLCDWIASLRSQ